MAGRRQLPDLMGEALGRLNIPPPATVLAELARPVLTPVGPSGANLRPSLANRLRMLGLSGMAQTLLELPQGDDAPQPDFHQRLGLMLSREEEMRAARRLQGRLRRAKLRLPATLEQVQAQAERGLEPALLGWLGECQWLSQSQNLLLTGPVGSGKTFLACALGHQACLRGFSVLYVRLPKLLEDLARGRAQGRLAQTVAALARPRLLALDDWGLGPLTQDQAADLLELAEARLGGRSTLLASRIDQGQWESLFPGPEPAQALLDRWRAGAMHLELRGGSLREEPCQGAKAFPKGN